MPVSFTDLLIGFDFASFDSSAGRHQALLCKRTGKIYLRSENFPVSMMT